MTVGPLFLALFVVAGQIKQHPVLAWLPVDLTVLCALIVVLGVFASRVALGPASRWAALPWLTWLAFTPAVVLTDLEGPGGEKIATLFTLTLLLSIAPFYLLRSEGQRKVFLWALAGVGVGAASWSLVVRPTAVADWSTRLVLEGTNTIDTARLSMSAALVILAFVASRRAGTGVRLVSLVVAVALSYLAFATGSRGPVLAAAAAVLALVLFAPMYRRYRGRSVMLVLTFGAIAVWVAAANAQEGFGRILSVFLGEADSSSSVRVWLWEAALQQIQANPLGTGWGSFASLTGSAYPHNVVLEVLVEAGWFVGTAVAVLLVASLVRSSSQATSPTLAAMFALTVFAIFNSLVSSDINGSRLLWVTLFSAWATGLPAVTHPHRRPEGHGARRKRR